MYTLRMLAARPLIGGSRVVSKAKYKESKVHSCPVVVLIVPIGIWHGTSSDQRTTLMRLKWQSWAPAAYLYGKEPLP